MTENNIAINRLSYERDGRNFGALRDILDDELKVLPQRHCR